MGGLFKMRRTFFNVLVFHFWYRGGGGDLHLYTLHARSSTHILVILLYLLV